MKFEIKDGIPLPENVGRPRKYDIDLDLLERGQMLKVNIAKVDISREAKILRNYILRYTHKNPRKKFSVRSLSDGVGIWRIKWDQIQAW